MNNKIMSAEEAAKLVKSGDCVLLSGFVSMCHPVEISKAIVERFEKTGEPNGVTLFAPVGMSWTDLWAKEKLVKKLVTCHIGLAPELNKQVISNKVEAYIIPFGPITHIVRAAAGKKPGILSRIGLGTFVDPRFGAGKVNTCSHDKIAEIMTVDGEEYIFYKSWPIDVVLLRGTTADEKGNITVENEAMVIDLASEAAAAKANGGIVIAQVERITKYGTLNPKDVRLPGILVDAIVVAKPENHWQSSVEAFNPALSGHIKLPLAALPTMPFSERKIINRRAVMEFVSQGVLNQGIGMPEGLGPVATEEGIGDEMTINIESGCIGGQMQGGYLFGASLNAEAQIDITLNFDILDSGVLDLTVLGMAEVDHLGNVNVSKFGPRIPGPGGFIDMTQSAKKIVFCGTFTAGDLQIAVENGNLKIVKEGAPKKFLKNVEQITFSAEFAKKFGQQVLYVTERAVFELRKEGFTLIEIAPGLDVQKDILAQMEFKPLIAKDLKAMDSRIFAEGPMGIRDEIVNRGKLIKLEAPLQTGEEDALAS